MIKIIIKAQKALKYLNIKKQAYLYIKSDMGSWLITEEIMPLKIKLFITARVINNSEEPQ